MNRTMHAGTALAVAILCALPLSGVGLSAGAKAASKAAPPAAATAPAAPTPSSPASPSTGWAPVPEPGTDVTLCTSLTKTLLERVSAMKALELAIAKDRTKPAPTLSGLFTEWSGGSYTGVAIKKKIRRMERERAMAVELNRLLAASGCAQVDIDAELQKATPGAGVIDEGVRANDPLVNDPLRNNMGR